MQIFGVHIHVGVRSPDKAIPMVNAPTYYSPHFLSLSASSPYWLGRDTGPAPCRSRVFRGRPPARPPSPVVRPSHAPRFGLGLRMLAAPPGCTLCLVFLDACHIMAKVGEARAGNKANMACTHHHYTHENLTPHGNRSE